MPNLKIGFVIPTPSEAEGEESVFARDWASPLITNLAPGFSPCLGVSVVEKPSSRLRCTPIQSQLSRDPLHSLNAERNVLL
jgi:hypothetical protein